MHGMVIQRKVTISDRRHRIRSVQCMAWLYRERSPFQTGATEFAQYNAWHGYTEKGHHFRQAPHNSLSTMHGMVIQRKDTISDRRHRIRSVQCMAWLHRERTPFQTGATEFAQYNAWHGYTEKGHHFRQAPQNSLSTMRGMVT